MVLDIRTPIEKERDARHSQICNDYVAYAHKFPNASPNRLFSIIAQQYNMSIPGVRNILVKNNLIQPTR